MRDYLRILKHPTHPLVFSKFRSHTLVPFDNYCANLRLANRFKHLPGAIVECRASIDDARDAMQRAGIRNPTIVKGWFENTLPGTAIDGGILILRNDHVAFIIKHS
jgi:hypothetical protein